MTNLAETRLHGWLEIAASWLTLRRLHAQAVVLALCLWGVCAVDFATPGLFDRAGNLKFQDFIQFPIAARLIAQGRADRLYDDQVLADGIRTIVRRNTRIHLQYLYGPQVALPFLLFDDLSFLAQAEVWVTFSLLMYTGCVYLVWKSCSALRKHSRLVALCAAAYPPVFHFFVRGHLSAAILVCFTAAYVAFLGEYEWLAGIALGFLFFKPQFLVAIPLVFLCARAWRVLLGLVASSGAQLAFTSLYFGRVVMRDYANMLLHSAARPGSTELTLSPPQMHSLHTFWELLIPWPNVVWVLYILSSLIVIGFAAAVWKSSSPLALRFSALLLAAVLVNPHIYIYDLLALAPVFLLLADWALNHPEHRFVPAMRLLLYLSFVLPLLGPLSRWTQVQLSVPAFALLLWLLWRLSHENAATAAACFQRIRRCINAVPTGTPMQIRSAFFAAVFFASGLAIQAQTNAAPKPKLTLDEFFNSVSFNAVEISPGGSSVLLDTERADWDRQIFRKDLWLYRADGSLTQLTESGHDTDPKWSPDGRWIAFLSDRKTSADEDDDSDSSSKDEGTAQVYLISPNGGEAFPATSGAEDVHAFSWSADSQAIYFATRQPWTKEQKDAYKEEWKDVVQYRTAERGDTIFRLELAGVIAHHASAAERISNKKAKKESADFTPDAQAIATIPLRVEKLLTSPDGRKLAFLSNAINQREEKYGDVEIYTLDLPSAPSASSPANAGSSQSPNLIQPHRVTNNQAVETQPRWADDSRHIFFTIDVGDPTGPYRDLQPHLYRVDSETGQIEQWAKDFAGPIDRYAVAGDRVLTSARIGTEVQMYSADKPSEPLRQLSRWPGTYARISVAAQSPHIAFVYSALDKPEEIYFADSVDQLNQARPITSFNKLFTERDLPQGKPYKWTADDGTTIEGMLIYPPGKFEANHLPVFTLIHGGPADADGNHFEADWYQWAALAATHGWLVFEPNYRGSSGYGDKFLEQIVPVIVSRPGKDILEGVDALVKDGIADPDHLTVGGYSYGGYMTNWLITQTTRFKAAVTGAGAVEHIGNWGNDDTTYDDAYFLGGRPWEAPQRYHDEAAIFQMEKVRTPTHMVGGADDIRVAVLEDYLLEHALYSLGIPNSLLIFPGEGHSLSKNPWHGKIKVREELKWLEKYGGVPAGN